MRRPLTLLGEASFVACSWTWCIGMFLPVLMVRDLGPHSFLVFALPNCIGAALVAVLVRNHEVSRRFVSAHAGAFRAFSTVTLAFQWYFAAWLLQGVGFSNWSILCIALFVAVFMLIARSGNRPARLRLWSIVTCAASLALLLAWYLLDSSRATLADLPAPLLPARDATPIAAVCSLGFLLCPVLDGTLHESLRRAAGDARFSFALGFLLLFPLLIVGTLLYAPAIIKGAGSTWAIAPAFAAWPVLVHMSIQLAFTCAAHEDALRRMPARARNAPSDAGRIGAFLVGVLLGVVAFRGMLPQYNGMAATELVYRFFMVFYGLIFPAYVWLIAWPPGAPGSGPTRARLTALAVVVLLALPFYYLGFIERESWWLLGGVAIILAARPVTTRLPPGEPSPPSAEPVPASPDLASGAAHAHATPDPPAC